MDALCLAQDPAADGLLSRDSFALLAGMLLDQQFPMERAFAGPYLRRTSSAASRIASAVSGSATDHLHPRSPVTFSLSSNAICAGL